MEGPRKTRKTRKLNQPDLLSKENMMATKAPRTAKADWAAPKLKGMRFAFTGRIKYKKHLLQWIKQEGARVLSKLTDQATHLIVCQTRSRPTADEQKAQRLNQQGNTIRILEERDFGSLLSPTRDEAIAMLRAGQEGRDCWNDLHPNHTLPYPIPMPDLAGANLRDMDLHELSFDGVNLDEADLRGANLSWSHGLKATKARLESANFEHASLGDFVD